MKFEAGNKAVTYIEFLVERFLNSLFPFADEKDLKEADPEEDPNSEPEIVQDEMNQLLDASNLTLEDVVAVRSGADSAKDAVDQ